MKPFFVPTDEHFHPILTNRKIYPHIHVVGVGIFG